MNRAESRAVDACIVKCLVEEEGQLVWLTLVPDFSVENYVYMGPIKKSMSLG